MSNGNSPPPPLVSKAACELSEPSNPLWSTHNWVQYSRIYMGIHQEVTCVSWLILIIHVSSCFSVSLLLPHFLCTFFLLKPVFSPLVASLLCVFPLPSLYPLLLTAVSHSPGASLLRCCISLSVSEGSHCHPQYAINIALADSYVVVMEVSRQHQHL